MHTVTVHACVHIPCEQVCVCMEDVTCSTRLFMFVRMHVCVCACKLLTGCMFVCVCMYRELARVHVRQQIKKQNSQGEG